MLNRFMRRKRHFSHRVHEVNWGSHLCSIYRNRREQLSVTVPYLAFGLQHSERCIYITDRGSLDICRLLKRYSIDAEEYLKTGQLAFLTTAQTYLRDGFFSPTGMLDYIEYSHYETLKSGYYGLRGSGELSDFSWDGSFNEKLIEYESRLNNCFVRNRLVAICQYDERKVPEEVLLHVLQTHPKAVIYGVLYNNPYYVPPQQYRPKFDEPYASGDYQALRNKIISQSG